MSDISDSEENIVDELIPNDQPGAERKGSVKRKKGPGITDLTSKLKRLKYGSTFKAHSRRLT